VVLKLYNSLTRVKEEFQPIKSDEVSMYVCGPTVYNPPHIGNARAAVVFDVLYRSLQRHYPNVHYVRNITDLDDKINAAALEQNISVTEITDKYTEQYHSDTSALGVLPPDVEPKATEHIPQMIELIQTLLSKGNAYVKDGHVLFDVPSFSSYGSLSGQKLVDMQAGLRIEIEAYKNSPFDFVLWKPSPDDLPGWDSPWGRGRPGWHMECSAMIKEHLGSVIDIHGGGNDLQFPHHENEIAQSCCANEEAVLAKYWIHNGFVEIGDEKMSKSLGNVLLVKDLLNLYPGEVIRLALIKTKYREPISWSVELLDKAQEQLNKVYGTLRRLSSVDVQDQKLEPSQRFCDAMDDDLNTSLAITELMSLAGEANRKNNNSELAIIKRNILGAGNELGLLQNSPDEWFKSNPAIDLDLKKVEVLIAKRNTARMASDWGSADAARDELLNMGVQILDTENGTEWRAK
jgi:cysteinyl-tRNA synthetase